MPYPKEHACRLKQPGQFESYGSGTRKHDGKTYRVIFGDGEEQAYRYPKDSWSVSEARAHCKAHNGISFEPASGGANQGLVLIGPAPVLIQGNKITGRAIHPMVTVSQEFPIMRKFLEEYLRKAVADSIFPLIMREDHDLLFDPYNNKITKLDWNPDEMAITYEGEVDDKVANDIRSGKYKNGVSVELDFPAGSRIEFVNGSGSYPKAVPIGFRYVGLSLITRKYRPTDPTSSVKLWNNAVKVIQDFKQTNGGKNMEKENAEELKNIIVEGVKLGVKEGIAEGMKLALEAAGKPKTDEERAMAHFNLSTEDWNKLSDEEKQEKIKQLPPTGTRRQSIEEKIFKHELEEKYPAHVTENFAKFVEQSGGTVEEFKEILKNEWTVDEITGLPNESFALVSEETRELPFKEKDGTINENALKRALEKIANIEDGEKQNKAINVLCEAANEISYACELCGTTTESLLVQARKELFAANDKTTMLEGQLNDEKVARAQDKLMIAGMIEGIIPEERLVYSHAPASAYRALVQNVRRVKMQVEKMET